MAEVRTHAEGILRYVQASGSGRSWATGTSQPSGVVAYVESFSYTSAAAYTQIMDRGIPDHHKLASKSPIDVTYRCKWTGAFGSALTASGATVPMWHLEHRASAAELGSTGFYHQFHGAVLTNVAFSEAAEGDTIDLTFRALAMVGPTASGYLG